MAEDGSSQSASIWPLVRFSFTLSWSGGSSNMAFQEVTGLNAETQVIEYRAGNSKAYSTVKMPGLKKYGNVTLKKGMFKGDTTLWSSFMQIKMNTVKRATVVISLLDETGNTVMSWTLANAFVCKITGTDMKADSNEIAVQSVELAHEGLTLNAAK